MKTLLFIFAFAVLLVAPCGWIVLTAVVAFASEAYARRLSALFGNERNRIPSVTRLKKCSLLISIFEVKYTIATTYDAQIGDMMSSVNVDLYPTPRAWSMKAQAVPNIPRGSVGIVKALRIILQDVVDGKPQNYPVDIPDSASKVTLGVCCQRLRPVGLVREKNNSWALSEEAERWLSSGDDDYLAAVLCANTKFMGEMLKLLKKPMKASELQDIANNRYSLSWKKTSEVNRRTVWLRDLGLVVFHDYSMCYETTDRGESLLDLIQIDSPESIVEEEMSDDVSGYAISSWAASLCDQSVVDLKNRKSSIGYCPGGKAELTSTFSAYVSFLESPRSKKEIDDFSMANYNIKASSARSFLNTLSGIKFVERISRDDYQATDLAARWNEEASPLDLCCCLHASCLFVFEILQELKVRPRSKNDLSAVSIVRYGFEKENGSEILKRIHFLELAGLLKDYKANEYAITQAGEELLGRVSIQSAQEEDYPQIDNTVISDQVSRGDDLLAELHLSSRDSSDPNRFERACAEAFRSLGFKSEWLGGSGKTDVLVSAYSAAKFSYRITVDAKSTANGLVNESQINFDTLVDHRKLHDARFTVVVAYGFQGERIVERAKKHQIVLMSVDSLCELIGLHERAPLSAQDYKALFEAYGLADLSVLEKNRSRLIRNGLILHAVMDCLASESDDEATGGTLSVRELYFSMKAQNKELLPTMKEINDMLEFLSSPMINCVGKTKDEYYAIGSLNEASNKFSFYANACLSS